MRHSYFSTYLCKQAGKGCNSRSLPQKQTVKIPFIISLRRIKNQQFVPTNRLLLSLSVKIASLVSTIIINLSEAKKLYNSVEYNQIASRFFHIERLVVRVSIILYSIRHVSFACRMKNRTRVNNFCKHFASHLEDRITILTLNLPISNDHF